MANIALITNNILSDSGTALTSVLTGSGTTNYLSKFTGSTALGNSIIYDNGTAVGIGTTSPTQKLQVGDGTVTGNQYVRVVSYSSDIYIGQSGGGLFGLSANAAANIVQDNSSYPLAIGTTFSQPLIFGTINVERMRIASSGNVLIGTTTDNGAKLQVSGNATITGNAAITGITSTGNKRLSLGILDINSGGTPTQIRINTTIPFASGSADFTVNIKGFRYGSAQMVSLSIGWHYYLSSFYNRNAISSGSWTPTITLACDASGYVVIHLSNPDYWPKLYVESVYSSAYMDSYSSGWTWTDADLSNCTSLATVTCKPLATDITGNSGSTSAVSGTTNYISKFTSSTAIGNSLVYDNGTNVGIGTTSPSTLFQVKGNGNNMISVQYASDGGAAGYGFYNSAGTELWSIGGGRFVAQDAFEISRQGSLKFLINSGGNVGIGTTSVGVKFVNSGGGNSSAPTLGSGTVGSQALLSANGLYGMYSGVSNSGDVWHQVQRNDGNTTVYNLLFQPSGGNVGIGTTSPLVALDVRGTVIITNQAGGNYNENLRLPESTSGYASLTLGGSIAASGTSAAQWTLVKFPTTNNFSIRNNNSDYVTVFPTGNFAIGTTTDAGYKLDVVNGAVRIVYSAFAGIEYHNTAGTWEGYIGTENGAGNLRYNSRQGAHTWYANSAANMKLTATGNLLIGTTTDNGYKLDVNGVIRAGSASSVSGSNILWGNYGNGALTTLGSMYSDGGPVLGYAVSPSTSGSPAFLSSTGITIARGAYAISGATHYWFGGSSQTVAIGSSVSMSEFMRIASTGNLLVGTSTDSGYKLDVNGTARINSTLALTSSTYAGTFSFYLSAANVFQASSSNIGVWLQVGGGNRVYIIGQEFNSTSRGNIFGNTVGGEAISATTIIAQSSGTTATTGLSLRYTINNTGTYSGISRGIYYNPTVTSLTGTTHRAIETVTGDVIFGSTSGNVGIGTTSPSEKLEVDGGSSSVYIKVKRDVGYALLGAGLNFNAIYSRDNSNNPKTLYIESANVLIGTTTDAGQKLQVNGSGNFNLGNSGYIKLQSGSGQRHGFVQSAYSNFLFSNNVYYDGSNWRYDQNGYGAQIQTETLSTGVIAFNTFASGIGGNVATIIESMRIVNNGNILMGDTNDYGFKLQVNGTSIFSDTIIQNYGSNPNASRGITSHIAQSNLTNDYVNGYYSGETISGELASTVVAGQVVAMKANSLQWELADASTAASIGKNMLGIACYDGNSTDVITILLKGFFASNTYYSNSGNYGVPMYLNASTNGYLTDVAPSTTGNIVRIVGHIDNYSNANSCTVIRFNPDNSWLVI